MARRRRKPSEEHIRELENLANLIQLEDSPQGQQQGIDLRPRSRKSTPGNATAVETQQGIATGAENEPREEPSGTPKSLTKMTQFEKVVDQVLEIIDLASKEMCKNPQ